MATPTDLPLVADKPKFEPLSPAQLAWRRFRKHRMAMTALVILGLLLLYIVIGGLVVRGYCPPIDKTVRGEAWANCNDTGQKLKPPSLLHPFGTDPIGRDILARTVYGGQISFLIGISAAIIEVILGTLMGAVAAFYGGWIDSLLMRITDTTLSFPIILFAILLCTPLAASAYCGLERRRLRLETATWLAAAITFGASMWLAKSGSTWGSSASASAISR